MEIPRVYHRCVLEVLFLKRFYLFIHERYREREREREAETQVEGESGSMQGAQRGTLSWDLGVTLWAKGGAKLLSHPAALSFILLM